MLLTLLLTLTAFADKQKVLFEGSSTIEFWKSLETDFPHLRAVNLGKGGTDYAYVLKNIPDWAAAHPDAQRVVLYSGDNDLADGKSPEQIGELFAASAMLLHEKLPRSRVLVLSVKPSLAREKLLPACRSTNKLIAKKARELGYVDFADVHTPMLASDAKPDTKIFREDGLHMKPEGYALWKKLLDPSLGGCEGASELDSQIDEITPELLRQHGAQARTAFGKTAHTIAAAFLSMCRQPRGPEAVHGLRTQIRKKYEELLELARDFSREDLTALGTEPSEILRLENESMRQHLELLARKLLVLDQELAGISPLAADDAASLALGKE